MVHAQRTQVYPARQLEDASQQAHLKAMGAVIKRYQLWASMEVRLPAVAAAAGGVVCVVKHEAPALAQVRCSAHTPCSPTHTLSS